MNGEEGDNLVWPLVRMFSTVSVVAIGGANAAVPEIHRLVVDQAHWMDNATFANVYAISQAAPGPNILIVPLVGWQVAGAAGLLAATAAVLTPSCLIAFAVGRLVHRVSGSRWFAITQDALVPIAVGLIAASGVVMTRAAVTGWLLGAIASASAALVVLTRRNPLWAILAGMAAAAVAHLAAG